jgi:SAM-dependent methyltransferase
MSELLSEAWGRHADTYARYGSYFTGYIAHSLFNTAAARLPVAPQILDVACGNGELSRAAALHCLAEQARTGRAGRVIATDFAPQMVALASRSLGLLGDSDLFHCELQDGQALTFDSELFDAVFSSFGIFLFPDRMAGWREAARVLRPGALLATAVWRGPDDNPMARLQMAPVISALPERIRASLPRPSWLDIASRSGLESELASAGFQDIEISVFDAALTAPSPAAMWEFMLDNPNTRALLTLCSETELAEVRASALASFAELAGGPERSFRLDASCHFALARRP